jgi:hypothetical protein
MARQAQTQASGCLSLQRFLRIGGALRSCGDGSVRRPGPGKVVPDLLCCNTRAVDATVPSQTRFARMDRQPRSPRENSSAALMAGARANLEVFRRERDETAEIVRESWKAIQRSRELMARSRDVSERGPWDGGGNTLAPRR